MITGEFALETSNVTLPEATRIGQVMQKVSDSKQSLIEIVLAADKERAALDPPRRY